ncbi:hypothetical protein DV096_15970 [Bradymonadaceae bacterium TMQ3]|uniref:Pilus assembly protein PilO n=1 Tax=Lujinxingia sediminis TaxID=2480984 RepID=A0ABY0CR86_9DELT|nr:type 4a pilus biogenesis protein PilO [Lujinxingia sediminis]RDV37008.1 hypothetical protein DV096_15970 [Bradymonadaceae bacterium TMQ3]RVU42912.1 hypothetical protein EA187_13830 [Lujinxingia sediminis]TXC73131.1 hypothetical protein FRC91_16910 [Bradymonadales bacterium TMQ1]
MTMNDVIDRFNAYPLGQKVLAVFILMIGIFVGFLTLIYRPMQDEIAAAETQRSELQRELGRLKEISESRAEVVARLNDLERQLHIAREKLPVSAEIPSLLQRIHNQAKTAGLEINRFRRNEDVASEDFIEIPVEMELVGSFDEVANFFYFVGRMTRIVNVKDINVSRQASGLVADGQLEVSAKATTYRWKAN